MQFVRQCLKKVVYKTKATMILGIWGAGGGAGGLVTFHSTVCPGSLLAWSDPTQNEAVHTAMPHRCYLEWAMKDPQSTNKEAMIFYTYISLRQENKTFM